MMGDYAMRYFAAGFGLILFAGCASGGARTTSSAAPPAASAAAAAPQDTAGGIGPQDPPTDQRHPNPPVIIPKATIMTAAGQEISGGAILFKDGRNSALGKSGPAPRDAVVVGGT